MIPPVAWKIADAPDVAPVADRNRAELVGRDRRRQDDRQDENRRSNATFYGPRLIVHVIAARLTIVMALFGKEKQTCGEEQKHYGTDGCPHME